MSILQHGGLDHEKLLTEIESDLSNQSTERPEFPLSSMSKTLFRAVGGLQQPGNESLALDIGTGCGVHAFLLNHIGFRRVLAIDSNERAVDLAWERGIRLGIECSKLGPTERPLALGADNGTNGHIFFAPISLQELANAVNVKFQLIVFNPPGFFFVREASLDSPAASGVYSGHSRAALDYRGSLLFQFFEKVVVPLLSASGEVICTWPGLERRTVELSPIAGTLGLPSHPADLLESWLSLSVECQDRNAEQFYCHTAVINRDYGLGNAFWQNLDHALQNPSCYSNLVKASDWQHGGSTTFRFGILHLRRSQINPLEFEVVRGGHSIG